MVFWEDCAEDWEVELDEAAEDAEALEEADEDVDALDAEEEDDDEVVFE